MALVPEYIEQVYHFGDIVQLLGSPLRSAGDVEGHKIGFEAVNSCSETTDR